MKMIASRDLPYGGRHVKMGETFECSLRDAKLLQAVKRAVPAPDDADASEADTSATDKQRYKRRDLRAEK